jgi:hypothetical protein
VDRAFRWFFAGIVVGVFNTALFAAFVGIPGIDTSSASEEPEATPAAVEDIAAPGKTFVLVVDEAGNVVAQRTELDATSTATPAPEASPGATVTPTVVPTPEPTPLLGLGAARFAEVTRPGFISARNGTAYVTNRTLGIQRVTLDGAVSAQSVEGIDNLGGSAIVDVDITTNGTMYALVVDDPLAWRLFRLPGGADEWVEVTSADRAGWPADVVALTVTDFGAVYISSSDPAGVFVLEGEMTSAMPWVAAARVLGLDTTPDDSRLLFLAPDTSPTQPAEQLRFVYAGRFATWATTFEACGATPLVPRLPRDVAIVDGRPGSDDTALVVDSLNHVVWFQQHHGSGQALFGAPCEAGADEAHLNAPSGVAIDEQGNVFIADSGNNRVVVLPRTGQ